MVCVGIDVAKDKHDCCILDSEGTTLVDCFTIPNNMDGFKSLLQTIQDCSQKSDKIKVGLEATGHYSYNILGFLLDNDLPVYVMNPLHTNLYRKSLSLRKTKTDRVDAKTIATMLFNDFVDVLKIPDITVLTPIMGSREPNDPTITSAKLAAQIPGSVLVDSLQAAADGVKQNAQPGDLVITLGCGDIYKASKMMVADNQ